MLILIVLLIAFIVFAIYMAIKNKRPDIKKLKATLEKGIGSDPQKNKDVLGDYKPKFVLASKNLNPKSIGQKFQHFKSEGDGGKYEVTLYYDEQKRCEDYNIKRAVEGHTYRNLKEYYPRNPKPTRHIWGQ